MNLRSSHSSSNIEQLDSLEMWGDSDDVELLEEIERVFNVKIQDGEAARLHTVGDLSKLLEAKLVPSDVGGKCRSAMCFYRLKKCILQNGQVRDIRPGDELRHLGIRNIRRFLADVTAQTGLRTPNGIATVQFLQLAVSAMFISLLAILLGWTISKKIEYLGLATFLMTLVYLRFGALRWRFPSLSIGEFAEDVAAINYGKLSDLGARGSAAEIWASLVTTVADQCDVAAERISRNTTFFKVHKQSHSGDNQQ